jgi:hypothetical protein
MPIEWDEPFGLVAAEAQVAGCPVAGYARGALPELVEQGVSGILVPPGDEARLVQAIGEACALDRYRVRRSGRARLLFDASLGRYEALLRKVAKGRHAACLPESMDTERRERTSPTDRWPFDPMPPGDHEPAHLPGGTATQMHEKDKARPKPKAKPVDPPPQAT